MQKEEAETIALQGVSFIFEDDDATARYCSLTGISISEVKENIGNSDFLLSILDYFINFEPDLIALASARDTTPEVIVRAWRTLGGGVGQEW